MTTISKKAAEEISNLMRTIVCNDTLCDYLLSDSFKEKLDPTDKSIYWKLRYEWADAIVRLDDKFGIQHPSLEYVLEKIDYLEDQKFMERQENELVLTRPQGRNPKQQGVTHMNKKQIENLILEGFGNLYPLTYTTFTDYRDKMYDDELKRERMHRHVAPIDFKPKFSVPTVARYFVLKAIRSAMLSNDFRPRDILHCKQSYILAHAIKDDDRFDLDAMFDGFDWQDFDSIEYSQGNLIFVETVNEVAA